MAATGAVCSICLMSGFQRFCDLRLDAFILKA